MEDRHYKKTYGISPVVLMRPRSIAGKHRFCLVCDGDRMTELNYANPEMAMKKAAYFVRRMYKDFTDYRGMKVTFSFRQV